MMFENLCLYVCMFVCLCVRVFVCCLTMYVGNKACYIDEPEVSDQAVQIGVAITNESISVMKC